MILNNKNNKYLIFKKSKMIIINKILQIIKNNKMNN